MELKILYEDKDLIVAVKPVGVPSEAVPGGGESMITLLGAHFEKRGVNAAAFPVHRLDMGVGGVMVYAKNKKSAAELFRLAAERKLCKEYLAILHGTPREEKGILSDLLLKQSGTNKTFVVTRMRGGVKKAVLSYGTVSSAETPQGMLSLAVIRLGTGRSHQIRAQFSSRSMPLAGDGKYGARDHFSAIALFSCRISFPHRGKLMTFIETPPATEPWTFFDVTSAVRERITLPEIPESALSGEVPGETNKK